MIFPGTDLVPGMARLRELELLVRGWGRRAPRDPDQELPNVELTDSERRLALERELGRRSGIR